MKKTAGMLLMFLLCLLPVTAGAEDSAKEASYQRALEFAADGEYDMAISVFEMLGDYSDSAAQIVVCRNAKYQIYYDKATELLEEEEYDAAKEIFTMLGDFKDSAIQAVTCGTKKKQSQYDAAMALAESGDYEHAKTAFELLGDFSDSEARVGLMEQEILKEKYEDAKALEGAGDYEAAISEYAELNGYSDSAERIAECEKQVYISELGGKIEEAISTDEFSASVVYNLLKEGVEYGLEEELIGEWYEQAYELETHSLYGNAARGVDVDINGDGRDERIVADDATLITLERTADGLAILSDIPAKRYERLTVEYDPSMRQYLCAHDNNCTDIYLIEGTPKLVAEMGVKDKGAEYEFTSSGFVITRTLTQEPLREKKTEYIVISAEQISTIDYPVSVDLSHYPMIGNVSDLISLYREAISYQSEEEIKLLLSDQARESEITEINSWLEEHEKVNGADIILWNEDNQDFLGIVYSDEDKLFIKVIQKEDGQFALAGQGYNNKVTYLTRREGT